jgi:hypothetical protein
MIRSGSMSDRPVVAEPVVAEQPGLVELVPPGVAVGEVVLEPSFADGPHVVPPLSEPAASRVGVTDPLKPNTIVNGVASVGPVQTAFVPGGVHRQCPGR